MGARASRVENHDAIDACIVGILADPKEESPRYTFCPLILWKKNSDNIYRSKWKLAPSKQRCTLADSGYLQP